ncbi:MAG: Dabb family protein [Bacteroidota bacterium]
MLLRLSSLGLLSILFFSCNSATSRTVRSETTIVREVDRMGDPGMIHSVYFYLNEGVSQAEVDGFMEELQRLGEIPSVTRFFIGPPAATEERGVVDNTFGIALIVWFDDLAGHDAYQVHQIHLDFIESSKHLWSGVKVYDNVVR